MDEILVKVRLLRSQWQHAARDLGATRARRDWAERVAGHYSDALNALIAAKEALAQEPK